MIVLRKEELLSMKFLDKNRNFNILLAGIISLIVGVGVARFVFTSILPEMLEDGLGLTFAGVLASINYVGYLSGSILAIFITDFHKKIQLFRIGLVLSVVTTIVLGITNNEILWIISRIIAGFGSAMVLVVGSAIVMTKLDFTDKTKAMGIHFSGIGFSILVTDLINSAVLQYGSWQDSWVVLTIIGGLLALYPYYILSVDKKFTVTVSEHKFDRSIFTPFVIFLIFAYFTEGVGFVIQGTFLPDIINSLEGLEGFGNKTWVLVGLAGIPSSIIWMRLAHKYGSVRVIIIAMSLQLIGILIPTFTTHIALNLFSGVLYGGTFVGLVALFLNLGGKLSKGNPVVLMGALTSAYGIGQVTAPLYAAFLTEHTGNYNYGLYVTALIVFAGVVSLFVAKRVTGVRV